ncbi:MAG: sulfotransferase [Ectothiorhodospiraceae bacterium]|jgi:hypothetical protein
MTDDNPIFIVGMPRSGTTLMRAALASHSRIAIAPETHYLNYWLRGRDVERTPTQAEFGEFWRRFVGSRQFRALDIDAGDLRSVLDTEGVPTWRGLFAELLRAHARGLGKPRCGEKTPAHHEHLARLLAWFPHARVIFMMRDPRSVVASLLDAPWAPPQLELHASRWRDCGRVLRAWEDDARVLPVFYEALVIDPQEELKRVCDFLNEPFDAGMLERSAVELDPAATRGDWATRHFARARGPFRSDSIDRWQQRLEPGQVSLIEYLTRREMRRLGYRPVTAGPGIEAWLALLVRRAGDRLRREVHRRRQSADRGAREARQPPGTDGTGR